MMNTAIAIAPDAHWIGVNDRQTDLFEGIWPLPHGASMNSFLVKGEHVAIIDGVCDWDGVPETLYDQFDQLGMAVKDVR